MLGIDFTQILLHMLNFVILAGGLIFFLFDPVVKFMDDRKKYFEDLQKKLDDEKAETEKLKETYEAKLNATNSEAEKIIGDYQKHAVEVAKDYLDETQEKAKAIIENAENDAEKRKEMILDSAQAEISELVLNAAQKLVEDTTSDERNNALYDEFIRRIGGKNESEENK